MIIIGYVFVAIAWSFLLAMFYLSLRELARELRDLFNWILENFQESRIRNLGDFWWLVKSTKRIYWDL